MLEATHTFEPDAGEANAATGQSEAAPAADTATSEEAGRNVPLPLRHDTLLGVCEAIGQDFHINADLLRVAFAIGLFWSPLGMIGLYLGLGAVVAVSRWFFPPARPAAVARPGAKQAADQPALPLAA